MNMETNLRERLRRFLSEPQSLTLIYDAFQEEKKHSIRARLNENLGSVFMRIDRGIYVAAFGEDGQAAIIEGDAWEKMKLLPDQSMKAVITDPPYPALNGQMSVGTTRPRNLKGGWDFQTKELDIEILQEIERVLVPGGHFWMFAPAAATTKLSDSATYNEQQRQIVMKAGLQFNKVFIWDKVSIGMGYVGRARHELIYHFSKGKPDNLGGFSRKPNPQHYIHDVLTAKVPRGKNRYHQTEKPTLLLADLLQFSTDEGDIVCDPFAGGLGIAEAAIATGRNAICIEIDPEAIARGMKRFE
jgi:site-specific DNA-methyltransferase (adenine-specific)